MTTSRRTAQIWYNSDVRKIHGVARMQTPSDVATAVRRFNNRPFAELSGRTPLVVEADTSFAATVASNVFHALWQQLYREKQTAERRGVQVVLEPPQGAGRATVKIRAIGPEATATQKEDIKAARARIENLLEGRVMSFSRDVIHLLVNKEGREELDKVFRGAVTPSLSGKIVILGLHVYTAISACPELIPVCSSIFR